MEHLEKLSIPAKIQLLLKDVRENLPFKPIIDVKNDSGIQRCVAMEQEIEYGHG